MFKRFRILVVFVVVLMTGIATILWWLPNLLKGPAVVKMPPGAKQGTEQVALPVPVRVFKVARIEFTDFLPTVGTVRGQTEVEMKFEVNGVVKSINFREGDVMTKGQVLMTLDERDAATRLAYSRTKQKTSEAQLALAQQRASINQQLFDIGAIIKAKLDEAMLEVEQSKTQVETAKEEVNLAQSELDKTVLRAPMDGVMGTREVESGEFVSPQIIVATIMDVGAVNVELGVIERDIERIRMNQKVKIVVDSLPNVSFQGTVDNLAPMIEGKSRTLTAKVKVMNPQGQLLPGMFARADIAVFEKPDALVVPTSSLRDNDGDGRFESVFMVEGEIAKLRPISLGYLTTDYAEVKEGIKEGEQVISEARSVLKDGAKVSLIESEEAGITRAEPKLPGSAGEEKQE